MYLRPYQEECCKATLEALHGNRSCIFVMPTGCGKTETVLEVIDRFMQQSDGQVLGLAHRQELVYQPWDRWQRKTGEIANMEMGEIRRSNVKGGSRVTFASKDSLHHRRLREALDRKSTRLNSSHIPLSRMPSSA